MTNEIGHTIMTDVDDKTVQADWLQIGGMLSSPEDSIPLDAELKQRLRT